MNQKQKNEWQITQARQKGITVFDQGLPLHSKINPGKEAQKWVDKQNIGKADIIIIHETGLGYLIQPLLKKILAEALSENIHEKSEKSIRAAIFINEREGLFELGEREGIYKRETLLKIPIPILILDPGNINQLFPFIEKIQVEQSRGHRLLYSTVPKSGNSLLEQTLRSISSKLSDLLTRIEFEINWIRQIILNTRILPGSKAVKNLFNRFKNFPAIIVGAGPSLIQGLDFLKKMAGRALIIATDTSLKILMKNGIKPDMVYTLDSQGHSLKHFLHVFDNEHAENIHLVADIVAYPGVLHRWPGPKWLSTTAKYVDRNDGQARITTPMADWVEASTGFFGDIQSGGSVSTSAFDLARLSGASPIVFIGQDFAYIGREIHARGTHHNDNWLSITNRLSNLDQINQAVINKRSTLMYKTLRSAHDKKFKDEKVISDYVFDLYRYWFEEAFQLSNLEVIFPATQGAFLQGVKIFTYKELDEYLNQKYAKGKGQRMQDSPGKILQDGWQESKNINHGSLRKDLIILTDQIKKIIKLNSDTGERGEILDAFNLLIDKYPFLDVINRRNSLFLSRKKNDDPEKTYRVVSQNIIDNLLEIAKALYKATIYGGV